MRNVRHGRFHVGRRTMKTAAAVVISMAIVNSYGATTSKLIFAMLGAMTAMENTFRESLKSCLTQIIGVCFGAIIAALLVMLHIPPLVSAGIGIVLVITLYNGLHLRLSPTIPCLIVVTICTGAEMDLWSHAFGRLWDTAIGLAVGIIINTLVLPYDNSRQIRAQATSMDRELMRFLEDLFDGDDHFPNTEKMSEAVNNMDRQLVVFASQWLPLHRKRQRQEYTSFRIFWKKARQLSAQMDVLCRMDFPGALSAENRRRLEECGAVIRDKREIVTMGEREIVTNYHVSRVLDLREELLEAMRQSQRQWRKTGNQKGQEKTER